MPWNKLFKETVESFYDQSMSDERVEYIRGIASSALEFSSSTSKRTHFVDNMLGNLTVENLMSKAPRKIRTKVSDAQKTLVSILTLAANVKQLSARARSLLKVKIDAHHAFTWKNQPRTLLVVIAYTVMCYYPHLVLVYPLVFIMSTLLIPEFLKRHPRPEIHLIVQKEKESLMLDFLGGESFSMELAPSPIDQSSDRSESLESDDLLDELTQTSGASDPDPSLSDHQSKRDILRTLSTLQVATSSILDSLNAADQVYKEYFGFGNEVNSTLTFYLLSTIVTFILLFGHWIPWRLIFVCGGWIVFASTHPWTKKLLENMTVERVAVPIADGAQTVAQTHPYTALNKIVQVRMGKPPCLRSVQIYQLERRAPLATEWSSTVYSDTMFLCSDLDRAAGREPEGVHTLAAISPPQGWKFGNGDWKVDRHPDKFISARGPEVQAHVVTIASNDQGWIYDKLSKEAKVDMVYEFRRKRLVHVCERV